MIETQSTRNAEHKFCILTRIERGFLHNLSEFV
jgi:hypothetical protein